MWHMIPSLQVLVEQLAPAFTQPSFRTSCCLFLGWIMSLRKRTLFRACTNLDPRTSDCHDRHDFDRYYNFFERSCWEPAVLAQRVMILVLRVLKFFGPITLLVDDTLLHKTGKCVWGLGWFRDAVASTRKRVATASGHNWVVIAIAYQLPLSAKHVLALPVLARLHEGGKGKPSGAQLALEMCRQIVEWFPNYRFSLVGDGGFANSTLLEKLPEAITFVGRMRGDAAVHHGETDDMAATRATKGERLPSPREAAAKADRTRTIGQWLWMTLVVALYGVTREVKVVTYVALWPRVLGDRLIRIVVVRDVAGKLDDVYLFTTDLEASSIWVIVQYSLRWSIEVLFRSSKQLWDIEEPQHRCQESVEKVVPWLWSMQTVVLLWYIVSGQHTPEAKKLLAEQGAWESAWSFRHILQVLRTTIVNASITTKSAKNTDLCTIIETLKSWAISAT